MTRSQASGLPAQSIARYNSFSLAVPTYSRRGTQRSWTNRAGTGGKLPSRGWRSYFGARRFISR